MRITASSPCIDGMIETRKSIVRPFTRSRKRPSCGTRFSAMSSSDITLSRLTIVSWCFLSSGSSAGCSTPSMRYLTITSRSFVSMWMSEARRSMAPSTSESTRRTIGLSAGSSFSSIAAVSSSATSCSRSPSLACSSSISPPRWRRSAAATRSAGASTASTGRSSRNSISSSFVSSSSAPKASTMRSPSRLTGTQP